MFFRPPAVLSSPLWPTPQVRFGLAATLLFPAFLVLVDVAKNRRIGDEVGGLSEAEAEVGSVLGGGWLTIMSHHAV